MWTNIKIINLTYMLSNFLQDSSEHKLKLNNENDANWSLMLNMKNDYSPVHSNNLKKNINNK